MSERDRETEKEKRRENDNTCSQAEVHSLNTTAGAEPWAGSRDDNLIHICQVQLQKPKFSYKKPVSHHCYLPGINNQEARTGSRGDYVVGDIHKMPKLCGVGV